jgi:hypothetical protein
MHIVYFLLEILKISTTDSFIVFLRDSFRSERFFFHANTSLKRSVSQRPVVNFTPRGELWPPEVNFVPTGEDPQFSPSFFQREECFHPWG